MFSFLLGLAAAQAAQVPPSPAAEPDVVVKGRAEAERRREADIFVRRVAPVPTGGQMARWTRPVCPQVIGLPDALNTRVEARIRAAAASVGAPTGAEGCTGNAVVAFTPDATGTLKAIERVQPLLIRGVLPAERQMLRASKAPVLWWSLSFVEGMDGNQQMVESALGPPILRHYRNSLISTLTRASYLGSVVVVDAERSTGVRLDAVADYAAFVILSGARFGAPAGRTASILDLFEAPGGPGGAPRPAGLTEADRAYLTGLYAMRPDRTARTQVRAITSEIVRDAGRARSDAY